MNRGNDIRRRILDGALETLARYGSRRFSMSSVSEHAKLARGTLYRYFPTKESLLDELASHVAEEWVHFLEERIDTLTEPDRLLEEVIVVMHDHVRSTPVMTQLVEAEPEFVRSLFATRFEAFVELVAVRIAPAFGSARPSSPRVQAMAELLVRLAMSYRLVEPDSRPQQPAGDFARRAAALLQTAASVPARGGERRGNSDKD